MLNRFRQLRGRTALLRAYKDVFGAADGPIAAAAKLVLDDLVDVSGFAQPSYLPGLDPAAVAYREGQKAVLGHILACLHYDEDYIGRLNILLDAAERQIANLTRYQE